MNWTLGQVHWNMIIVPENAVNIGEWDKEPVPERSKTNERTKIT